jgi:hypothetical protein
VLGLAGVMVGLAAAAVVLLLVPPSAAGWAIAPALLVGGIGGGFVISPNITMTLRDVPVAVAGSAGGGLQTAQRFGAAVGTAALPGLFYLVLASTGDYPAAAAAGLAVSVLGAGAALVLGVVDLRRNRAEDRDEERGGERGGERDDGDRTHDRGHPHVHAWHH